MTLSNSMYDRLKFIALVCIPIIAVTYWFWSFPEAHLVVLSLILFQSFFGLYLLISSERYKNKTEGYLAGTMEVAETSDGRPLIVLNYPGEDPADVINHDKVTFLVRKVAQLPPTA